MAAKGSLRLPRRRRITARRDFVHLKAAGQRWARGCLLANWLELPSGAGSQVGVVVGRKLGPAVQRNRARRLLREAFRLHQHKLRQPVKLILVGRHSINGKRLADVERDFLNVLRAARLLAVRGTPTCRSGQAQDGESSRRDPK